MTEASQPVNEISQLPPHASKRPRRTRWVIWTLGTIVFLVLLLQGIGQLESRASSQLYMAVELVSQDRPVEAIETLDDLSQQTCRLFGRGTEVDETLALAHKMAGNYELALSFHDRLIARFAGDANELAMRRIDRAHTLRAARRTEEALQEFEKAKEEMSRIADAEFKSHALSLSWDGIRRTQLDIGQDGKAEEARKKVLEYTPGYFDR